MHELGHLLGYEHTQSHDAMHPTLPLGVRRLPTEIDLFAPDEAEPFEPWQEDTFDADAIDEIFGSLEPI